MAMFPKGSSKGSPQKAPPVDPLLGALVQYEDDGAVLLGVITAIKKDKLQVLNQRGREAEFGRARLYVLPGRDEAAPTTSARTAALETLARQIEKESLDLNVAELWSFVSEERRVFTAAELSESYFGSDSTVRHGALRVALIRERIHFKRDKDGFEPRAPEIVEELDRAEENRRKKHAVREATLDFLEQRAKDATVPIPKEIEENLRLMSEIAAGVAHTDPARQKDGKELVSQCCERLHVPESATIEKRAFEVLVKLRYFHRDTNLSFIRYDLPVDHDPASLEEAHAIDVPAELADFSERERAFREDLTDRNAFTVDDASTKDMDDAISMRQTLGGFELGIHITDVAYAVLPETKLDLCSRRRSTSVYCADQTVNMLPPELSEAKLSLTQQNVRPCISVLLTLNHNYEIVESRVLASFVRVAERLTYDEVDRRLEEGDQTLITVHDIAAAFEEGRIRSGAVKVQKREVVPLIEADGSVRLLEIEEDSPARSLVAEMMVLANSIMARFAADHAIPVLYRGQERPDEESQEVGGEVPEGPAKDFGVRAKLKKSTVSFDPQHHAGLGLSHYIQATSPIRRYMDLVHQRQFLSYFRSGKPWLTREQLEPLALEVENHLQAASQVSRETKRYWLFRYLEQRDRKRPIGGTVVRVDMKSPLVELDEVYLTVFVRVSKQPKLGDRVTLRITSLDPHADYLRLEVVG